MSLPWIEEPGSLPWTDCPACPGCSSPTGTPAVLHETPGAGTNHLLCCACGARWVEVDLVAVARAWYAAGAWEGRQAPLDPPAKGKGQET